MKCPKCGKEMRKGGMEAKRPILLTPNDQKGKFPQKCIKLRGILDPNEIKAEICEGCRCMIVEY